MQKDKSITQEANDPDLPESVPGEYLDSHDFSDKVLINTLERRLLEKKVDTEMRMTKAVNIFDIHEETERGNNHYVLNVGITDKGDLLMSGVDCGDFPKEVWGDDDYEYWLKIDKVYKDDVLLWLIKERFQKESDFQAWLEEKKIPNKFDQWI